MPCRLMAARPPRFRATRETSRVVGHAEQEGRQDDDAEARIRAGSSTAADRRARQGAEEQHRQGEIAHEGIEGGGRLAAQDAPAAGQIPRQDDAEDRQSDVEDGLHGSEPSIAVCNSLRI